MTHSPTLPRRDFLRVVMAGGVGLVLGFRLPDLLESEADDGAAVFEPNAWLRIDPDDAVTIRVAKAEMGQGVYTSMAAIVAEELECDWARVRIEFAPAKAEYANPALGQQATGGSTSVRSSIDALRAAGAAARDMLRAAAATRWGVGVDQCRAEAGMVLHTDGRKARFGELATAAAGLPVPRKADFKDPASWRILGTALPRRDTPLKVDGSAEFGIDVKLPGLQVATVLRCPVFGGTVARHDATAALAVPGVKHVVPIDHGLAVVADSYWAARKGRDALQVEWSEGDGAGISSDGIRADFAKLGEQPGLPVGGEGNVELGLAAAVQKLDAVYEVPFLHHATMEPMNATADVRPDGCDVYAPTQAQTRTQATAAAITGLPVEKIRVHSTFLGGGFGRRFEVDFIADAVQVSKAIGAPVKVIWSREEDTRHGFYRPTTWNRLAGGLDAGGNVTVWHHRIVGPSIMSRVFPAMVAGRPDPTSIEGAANLPYAVPIRQIEYTMKDTGVPVGFWRSVGSSQNAFVTESFIDELACAAGKDPFAFRRALLGGALRHKAVLELAAEKAEWDKPAATGRFRGIAVAESFGSYVAQVAEVSVSEAGQVRVHRVVCAVDCGVVINPNTVVAQMESGIVYGLTAALRGRITIARGRVQQGNFDDYPLLRMDEMPTIDVHIVPGYGAPGGIGEPGVPPIAPAVTNAIFAATGKRVRQLPISLTDLKRR